MPSKKDLFTEAAYFWDLDTLYSDLASAKGKHLTPTEKVHLRGLLCSYSPSEIAQKLSKSVRGVEVELCNTLYQYHVKNLVERRDEKIENWRNICEWLEDAGYKKDPPIESQSGDYLSAKLIIKKANIVLEKNHIVVDINLKLIADSPSTFTEASSESITESLEVKIDESLNNHSQLS